MRKEMIGRDSQKGAERRMWGKSERAPNHLGSPGPGIYVPPVASRSPEHSQGVLKFGINTPQQAAPDATEPSSPYEDCLAQFLPTPRTHIQVPSEHLEDGHPHGIQR